MRMALPGADVQACVRVSSDGSFNSLINSVKERGNGSQTDAERKSARWRSAQRRKVRIRHIFTLSTTSTMHVMGRVGVAVA